MLTKRPIVSVLAVLALVVAPAAAYAFDALTFALVQQGARTFNLTPVLWVTVAFHLLLAAGLVGLAWWLATRAVYPRAIDVLYVAAGLAAILFLPLDATLNLGLPAYGLFNTGRVSFWSMTGALLAAAGLFHLLRRNEP